MAIVVLLAQIFVLKLVSTKKHLSMQKSFYYETWLMTTKFSVPADSTLKITYRSKNRSIYADKNDNSVLYYEIGIYLDDDYDKAMVFTSCEMQRQFATQIIDVGSDLHGAWSDELQPHLPKETTIYSAGRPHIYYFVIMDCFKTYAQKFSLNPRNMGRPQLELTLLNKGNDHFAYEDIGSLSNCSWLLLLQLAFGLLIIKSYQCSIKLHERYMSPHVIMLVSLVFQLLSQMLLLVHLWTYSINGEGVLPCEIISKIFEGISEVIMSMLLIQLISGWTVTYQDIELDDNMEIYVPIMIFIVMVEVIITALTFVDVDSSAHRYHDFTGIQGYILLLMKFSIYAYFAYKFITTKTHVQRRSFRYYTQLFMIGSSYLLAVPISIIVTYAFEEYERQHIFNLMSGLIERTINVFLMYQVSYKGSSWQLGNLDSNGVLPFGFSQRAKIEKSNLD